jgi:GAF domain-containing protein/DNA-binding CsgD family transcriptional regulator
MAITHDHPRIVSTDGGGTGRNDQIRVTPMPDQALGVSPTDRTGANALLRSLLAIQCEDTLPGRLQRLVDAAVDLLQRTDVAVAVTDETSATPDIAAAAGRLMAARGRRVSVLDELVGAVVQCGESRLFGDVSLDPRLDASTFSILGETRSWLGVPLVGPTGAFGALVVADTMPHGFDFDDEQTLHALAGLTSATIDDARSREIAERRRERGDEPAQCPPAFVEAAVDWSWEQDTAPQPPCPVTDEPHLAEVWPPHDVRNGSGQTASHDVTDEPDLELEACGPLHDVATAEAPDGVATAVATPLDTRSRQLTAVADLGRFALAADDLQDVLNAAAMVIAGVFEADCSQVLRLRPDGSTLMIEAGLALPNGLVVSSGPKCDATSQCGYALAVGEPVAVDDLSHEHRFRPMPALLDRGMVSGVLVPITRDGRSYGLLGLHARRAIEFTEEDLQFLRSVGNILATAIDATRSRHVTDALIEQASDPIARYDAQLRVLSANEALGLAVGRPVSELLGQTLRTLSSAPSPQIDNWEMVAQSVFRSGREREAELSWPTPFGPRDYQMRFVPELVAHGQVESVLVIARDVSDRKRLDDERAALYDELLERDLRLRELISDLRVEHREERAQDRRLADATFIESQMTAREVEILGMVVAGLTNQQIAARLHLSAGTVRNRLGHLFPKLDVVNRAQAAARAVELGLVTPSGV